MDHTLTQEQDPDAVIAAASDALETGSVRDSWRVTEAICDLERDGFPAVPFPSPPERLSEE
jgi:hypothetical protein